MMKEDHETNKEATLGSGIRRSPSTRRGDEGWKIFILVFPSCSQ
jgi:hypothetical protein